MLVTIMSDKNREVQIIRVTGDRIIAKKIPLGMMEPLASFSLERKVGLEEVCGYQIQVWDAVYNHAYKCTMFIIDGLPGCTNVIPDSRYGSLRDLITSTRSHKLGIPYQEDEPEWRPELPRYERKDKSRRAKFYDP